MITETFPALLELFSWSMNVLLSGVTPEAEWSGKPLASGGRYIAEGWRGALCQIRGDWQFFCELFGFPTWNSAVSMCWMCGASSTIEGLLWTDFSEAAGWRAVRKHMRVSLRSAVLLDLHCQ